MSHVFAWWLSAKKTIVYYCLSVCVYACQTIHPFICPSFMNSSSICPSDHPSMFALLSKYSIEQLERVLTMLRHHLNRSSNFVCVFCEYWFWVVDKVQCVILTILLLNYILQNNSLMFFHKGWCSRIWWGWGWPIPRAQSIRRWIWRTTSWKKSGIWRAGPTSN